MLGLYYLSLMNDNEPGEGMAFGSYAELEHALDNKIVTLHTKIKGRVKTWDENGKQTTEDRRDHSGPHADRPDPAASIRRFRSRRPTS